jgi:hypothetical protein
MNTAEPKRRNPWPITITAFFIVFFSGLVAFIIFASTQRVDLVRADYYEQEIHFQQQMERVNRTRNMADPAAVSYHSEQRCITIRLPSPPSGQATGQIHLYRPSDARLDQQFPLALQSDGTQRVDVSKLRVGLWKVRVQWELAGKEYYVDQPIVIRPAA